RLQGDWSSDVCSSDLPDNVIASFLAGYIAGDGSFREFWLEIATASQEMALGLSYLLARLGILHRARQRRIANHTYHRVNIEGKQIGRASCRERVEIKA